MAVVLVVAPAGPERERVAPSDRSGRAASSMPISGCFGSSEA
ncbi:MAG TPA: hypothetical protein VH092_26595 [Urbifossiella sp.]|nr:hypothetical protein [Urbifossiella sp.]